MSYNKIIIVGHLTREPELRYLPNGTALVSTAIAASHKFTSNGEKKEETMFIDLTFFGRTAENVNQYLRKGSKLLVDGRLKFDSWERDGARHSKHSILVETMEMLDSKPQHERPAPITEYQNAQGQTYQPQQQQQQHTAYREPQRQMPQPPQGLDFEEDVVPF